MEIEKVHSQIGNFIKDPKTDGEKYTQIYPENTDKDVLIETENSHIPKDINTLSDLVSNLGSQAFVNTGIDSTYPNIYHGNGIPTTTQVSEPNAGDLYVNNLTGEIYQYMGVKEPYSEGAYKIHLSNSSYKFILSGNYVVANADIETGNGAGVGASNINLSAIFDGDNETSTVIPKTNQIVFDLGEEVRLQKVIIHYKTFPTYYKQTIVNISNSTYFADRLQYNSEDYMSWITIASGLSVNGIITESATDSVDSVGTGYVTINIKSSDITPCRFISIMNNSSNIDGLAGIEVFAKTPSNVINEGKWVLKDTSPNRTVIGRKAEGYSDVLILMDSELRFQENQVIPVYIDSDTSNGLNDLNNIWHWNGKSYDEIGQLQANANINHSNLPDFTELYKGFNLKGHVIYLQYILCGTDKVPEFRVVHDPLISKIYSLIKNNQITLDSYSTSEIKNLVDSAWN